MKKLTIKQEKFCNRYIESGNASDAYRYAYDCEKMKEETINRKAIEVINNGKVKARLTQLKDELKKKSDITKERIIEEVVAVLNAKITDYLDFDGHTLKFKSFAELTENQIKAIESIKEGKFGIELKLHGKEWSIDRICKMLGYDSPTKIAQTDSDGNDIDIAPLTPEKRKEILKKWTK